MAGEINISVLLRFMADEARRQMSGTGTDLRNLGGAAEEAARKATSAGQAIDQTGSAAQGAASGISTANAAMSETVTTAGGMTAEMGRAAMSVAGARDVVTGLGTATSAAIQPVNTMTMAVNAQQTAMQKAVAAWTGLKDASAGAAAAELRHGMMLDDIRAKFNPLFASSRQYEMELREIAEAERLGAISASEAAAARDRAAQAMRPMGGIVGQYGAVVNQATGHTANLFSQWNDIAVMMAAGQNPMQMALQQGTQVSQVLVSLGGGTTALRAVGASFLAMLNPISLATIGIIAFGGYGVQWLSKLGGETKSFDGNLNDLNATLTRMRTNLDLLGNTRLEDTFGNLTGSVRGLAQGMLELDRASELKQLGQVVDTFLDKEVNPKWYSWDSLSLGLAMGAAPIPGMSAEDFAKNTPARSRRYQELGAANSYDDFEKRTKELKDLAEGGDVEAVVKKLQELQAAMSGSGSFTGMKKELRDLFAELAQAGVETAQVEALVNGTARANAITHQIDQMVQGYTQQAELAEATLRFGENSTQVEQVRARQAREVLRIKFEEMDLAEDSEDAIRARAALEAKIEADAATAQDRRQKAQADVFRDLNQQLELTAAIQNHGEDAAEVEALRARHAWDMQRARLEEMGLGPQLIAQARQLFQLERDRAAQIKAATAAKQADELLDDLREEAAINQAILRYGEDSVQVKELQIAAERRAFEQTLATMQVSEAMKGHLREAWEAARGLASADPFGSIATAREYLRDQQERIDKLRLEQSLLGQNEAIQKRILALWQVERDIRREGIDPASARAAEMRALAVQEAELTRTIERQKDAWGTVQSAAESAIDGIVDSLKKGDIEGALEALADDVTGAFAQLAIANPLKNAILGTDYASMQDVGGLQGIWARLTGRGETPDISPANHFTAPSMSVTAGTVNLTGSIAGSFPGATAANDNLPLGAAAGGLTGARSVQEQVWKFFSGKGLEPHMIAAILGNVSGESGFNPLAKGDYRNGQPTSFGLFQHHASRADGLLNAVGGLGDLGNVDAQLEFVWRELQTTHNAAFRKLLETTNVQDATSVWMRDFEVPSQAAMAQSWPKRLGAAEEALQRFGNTAAGATGDLGTLGEGFGAFGNALGSAVNGMSQGGLGGLLNSIGTSLGNWVVGALGIPGFATGGRHEGGLRIVGERGPELEYTGPSTILPADLTRSILAQKSPVVAMSQQPQIDTRPVITINNNASSAQVGELEESTGPRGQRQFALAISDAVAQGHAARGGQARKTMRQLYNVAPGPVRRS